MRRSVAISFAAAFALLLASVAPTPVEAGVSLKKRITTDGNCANAVDPLHVNAGTGLTYCYAVKNYTGVTITVDAIEDDVLGTVFTGPSGALAPSASQTFTESVTATVGVTNTAVVTATGTVTPFSTFTRTDTAVLLVCGDGQLDDGEQCDDGNNVNLDGCDENCQLEPGAVKCPDNPGICDDGDDVDAATEDGVDGDMDGNDDGIEDSLQPTVTSLPSATDNGYLTLIVESGNRGDQCRNTMVAALTEGDLPSNDPDHDFP
jgi:cysteine-rich repeat protein